MSDNLPHTNVMWLVHAPTGGRVRLATQTGLQWHFRSDNEVQREFDQLADQVAAHERLRASHNTDANFVLELLDATNAPHCFGVNQTPSEE